MGCTTAFLGIPVAYLPLIGILFTIISIVINSTSRIQQTSTSVKNASKNRITQTAMSTLLMLTQHPNRQQQRIRLSRRIEIAVISMQTFVLFYAVLLAIILPGLLSKISDQDIRTRLIIL